MAFNLSPNGVLRTLLKIGISTAAIWFLVHNIDPAEARELLKQSSPMYGFIGLVLLLVSQLLSAERLNVVLNTLGIRARRIWNYQLYFIGMAYNLFLPGGIGGDGYKVLIYHREFGVSKKKLLTALLVDRLSGLLAILVLLGIGVVFIDEWRNWMIPALIATPLVLISARLITSRFFPGYSGVFARVTLIALGVQLIQVVCIWFLGKAMNFEADLIHLSVFFLVSTLATTIPVFLGGIGAREAVFALLATQFGMNAPVAVATALAFSMVTVIASVPGLVFDWTLRKQSAQ